MPTMLFLRLLEHLWESEKADILHRHPRKGLWCRTFHPEDDGMDVGGMTDFFNGRSIFMGFSQFIVPIIE